MLPKKFCEANLFTSAYPSKGEGPTGQRVPRDRSTEGPGKDRETPDKSREIRVAPYSSLRASPARNSTAVQKMNETVVQEHECV